MKSKIGLASILLLLATLILKVSGLLRDILIAFYFGDSYMADAYLAAFVVPNMLILFLATGMKNALVPSYIQSIEDNRASYHLAQVFKGTVVLCIFLSLAGALLAPYLIPLLYPNFEVEATEIAVRVTIILFSAVVFAGMNSVLEAYFDAENKYSLSVVSQVIVILCSIVSLLLFSRQLGVYALAYGYLLGTIISIIFKIPIAKPNKIMMLRNKFDWNEVKKFYIIFIPVGLTVAVGQINLTIDNVFASYFDEGTVTYINYAKNLVHFPQAIIGVTIGTVIFPILAKAKAKANTELFKEGIAKGLIIMLFILLPSLLGMMLLMPNIIELLYQRGAFDNDATKATSEVAYYYFGSVLFFSLLIVINKGFYIYQKGHYIMMLGLVSICFNILLNYLFTNWIGYIGIPLSSSVVALFYTIACLIIFLKLSGGLDLKYISLEYIKIILCTSIMVVIIYCLMFYTNDLPNITEIITVSIVGSIVFLLSSYFLKVNSLKLLLGNFFSSRF